MFDLVQKEYGWTDEYLLGLTLGRLKIAVAVVVDRMKEEQRARLLLAQQQTRAIMGVLPGLAFSEKAGKEIRKAARDLSFLPPDDKETAEKKMPTVESVKRLFGGRPN